MGLVNQVLKNLRRSPYQAAAAIFVLTLTFFVSAIFILLAVGSARVLNYFQQRPQVSAYFKDSAIKEEIETIKSELEQTGLVSSVKFISKEEALAIYREQNREDPLLLELVTADILPASLEISAKDPANLSQLATNLKEKPQVDEVVFQKDIVDRMAAWITGLRIGGAVLIGFLIFVSLIVILMITSLRIAARREEISIMQLVGATKWFIARPFILEGVTYGLAGAFLGTAATYILFFASRLFLVKFLVGLPFFPITPLILTIVGLGQLFGGLVIGSFGSLIALNRYLR